MQPQSVTRRVMIGSILCAAAAPAFAAPDPHRFESGHKVVDDGVGPTLEYLSRLFRLEGDWLPDFTFFDDGNKPNSFADRPIIGIRRPFVKIGRGAVGEAMKVSNGDFGAALTGVFAHEFAHICQMYKGTDNRLRALDAEGSLRLVETHADFMAGWAIPQAWWITSISDLRIAAEQFSKLGDIQFEAAGHHGTSLQRQTIMASGYTWGLSSPDDPDKASERGITVLRDLFPQWFRGA